MNDRCPAFTRFHYPLKADGVVLRHVGAHDENTVGVLQILLKRRRSATAE